jgi:antitoxin CptB
VTVNRPDIVRLALYIPLARPRPGFWRLRHDENFWAMTERSSDGLDERRRRLLFRAWRRGVREMDLIVGRFADAHIAALDEPALDDFERLIEVPNVELYAWVSGAQSVPQAHDSAVLRQLIAFHNKAEAMR